MTQEAAAKVWREDDRFTSRVDRDTWTSVTVMLLHNDSEWAVKFLCQTFDKEYVKEQFVSGLTESEAREKFERNKHWYM